MAGVGNNRYRWGVNWLDVTIVASMAGGALLGARRGLLRLVAMIVAFYVSLILAARYYGPATGFVAAYLLGADRSVTSAYALAGITVGGTLALTWLSHVVYGSTALPRVKALDNLAGAGLGIAWSWAVVAFAVSVTAYGISFSWGPNDLLRAQVGAALDHSRAVQLVRGTLPILRDSLLPWLPGGLPVPLST
jgi:uncharacterized membrane protein required for colicin V production